MVRFKRPFESCGVDATPQRRRLADSRVYVHDARVFVRDLRYIICMLECILNAVYT